MLAEEGDDPVEQDRHHLLRQVMAPFLDDLDLGAGDALGNVLAGGGTNQGVLRAVQDEGGVGKIGGCRVLWLESVGESNSSGVEYGCLGTCK